MHPRLDGELAVEAAFRDARDTQAKMLRQRACLSAQQGFEIEIRTQHGAKSLRKKLCPA
jgi:hypothetical protein